MLARRFRSSLRYVAPQRARLFADAPFVKKETDTEIKIREAREQAINGGG